VSGIALALLYPARLLAALTEHAPAPGGRPAALYVVSTIQADRSECLPLAWPLPSSAA
jgi:hypothetical protein